MLQFHNGIFRILQLTDMQDTYRTSQDTVNLTEALIRKTKPDLIVLTGDQIKGYGTYFRFGDNRANAATTLNRLLKPIADSGIPFTAVFGNHDAFGDADKEFQWLLYRQYENFIGNEYLFDCIPIASEDGKKVPFCIYLFDSREKQPDGSYPPINQEQIHQYRETRDQLERINGFPVPALAFQHIPPVEIYESLSLCRKHDKGAIQGARTFADRYYRLPNYARNERSFMGENAATPDTKSGQIEAFGEKGDVLGLYFGHDHNNSFVVKHGNLDLGYTQGCGFNIYGPGKNRGGRVFDIREDSPDRYETFTVTCRDLPGFRLRRPVKEFLYTHSPSSVSQAKKAAKKVLIVSAVCTVSAFCCRAILRKR